MLDLASRGKRQTWLEVGCGRGRTPIKLPVIVVSNGPGPSVLFTGGNHGDEYEGPIALLKLARELKPDHLIRGSVVVMPALNPPALASASRTSPLDGANLNREFPGTPRGSPTQRIAHRITADILPAVDYVIDLHAGGQPWDIIPSVMVHDLRHKERMERTLGIMRAFRAPVGILIKEYETEGMIDTTVERMGKIFCCCELGGLAKVTPETLDVTETGIRNVLKHLGMLRGKLRTAAWRGKRHPRVLEALSYRQYVKAKASGLFEPFVDIADKVRKGQVIGQIHDPQTPGGPPVACTAPLTGIVYSLRLRCLTDKGQQIAIVAKKSRRF